MAANWRCTCTLHTTACIQAFNTGSSTLVLPCRCVWQVFVGPSYGLWFSVYNLPRVLKQGALASNSPMLLLLLLMVVMVAHIY